MKQVLVFGSLNMDMTIFTERLPEQGETLMGSDFKLSPGGKGANQAVAAARLGASVAMLGCVGEDAFGRALIESLRDAGVDTGAIRVAPEVGTGGAVITVANGDNRIILYPGANALPDAGFVDCHRALLEQSQSLMVQLEVPLAAVERAMELARQAGKRVFVNPAPARPLPEAFYRLADYLVPNETEAALLLGRSVATEAEVVEALVAFRARGVREPIITLGARGAAFFAGEEPRIVPGLRVNAVDTTAAGDTFIGALAAAIGRGDALSQAIDFAQRAAALCVGRKGAQASIPTLAELSATKA